MLFSQRPPLDVVMRGYDRRQVDDLLERLEADASAATADRDAALARSADLAAQLANSYAETESLRRKLRAEASSVVTAENVSDRIRAMLELAEEEAARIREEADHYGVQVRRSIDEDIERIRSEAQAEAERMTSTAAGRMSEVEASYQARIGEGDSYLAEQRALAASESRASRAALEAEIAQAAAERQRLDDEHQTERQRLDDEHQAERERLDAEHLTERERLDAEHLARREEADTAAAMRRDTATEDFEIALRTRRTAEEQRDLERRRSSEARARTLVDDARREADGLLAAAHAELLRLRNQRESAITQMRAANVAIVHTLDVLAPEPAAPEPPAPAAPAAESDGEEQPEIDLTKSEAHGAPSPEPSDEDVALALEEGEAADDPGVEGDLDRADSAEEAGERRSIFAHAHGAAPVQNAAGDSADPDAAAPASSTDEGGTARR